MIRRAGTSRPGAATRRAGLSPRVPAAERGVSFKEALNTALRHGLAQRREASGQRYRVPTRDLGLPSGIDLDKALQFVGDPEDVEVRKLELRRVYLEL